MYRYSLKKKNKYWYITNHPLIISYFMKPMLKSVAALAVKDANGYDVRFYSPFSIPVLGIQDILSRIRIPTFFHPGTGTEHF
jgi:hypothetical protein